ncbi:MAG: hypothetical protein HRT64_13575 [Erythrobacter sp.]|nr:hypothetical protein [Erythrobacter sp.]
MSSDPSKWKEYSVDCYGRWAASVKVRAASATEAEEIAERIFAGVLEGPPGLSHLGLVFEHDIDGTDCRCDDDE